MRVKREYCDIYIIEMREQIEAYVPRGGMLGIEALMEAKKALSEAGIPLKRWTGRHEEECENVFRSAH